MKNEDIEKLHQSLRGTLSDFKKAMQDARSSFAEDSYEKKSDRRSPPIQEKIKEKKASNEIDEEIAEDIEDSPIEQEIEMSKSSTKAEPLYHGGKPLVMRKARPISATYNQVSSRPIEPVLAKIPLQDKYIESKRVANSPKFHNKTEDNSPFNGSRPITNPLRPTSKGTPASLKGINEVMPKSMKQEPSRKDVVTPVTKKKHDFCVIMYLGDVKTKFKAKCKRRT